MWFSELLIEMEFFYNVTLLLLIVAGPSRVSPAGLFRQGAGVNTNLQSQNVISEVQGSFKEQLCNAVLLGEVCQNGYYQEYAALSLQCGDPNTARMVQETCFSNSEGQLCSSLAKRLPGILSECVDTSSTCTAKCRHLLTAIQAELGCCINAYNDSNSHLYNPEPFRHSLWSLCEVEPVNDRCVSSIDLSKVRRDPACNDSVYNIRQLLNVQCRSGYVEPTRDALNARGCQDGSFYSSTLSRCEMNTQGHYCATLPSLAPQFEAASVNCEDTSVCNPLCVQTLTEILDTFGCCFLRRYNSTVPTSSRVPWLEHKFFSMCNLASPGACEPSFNDAAIPRNGAAIVRVPAIILTALLTFMTIN